MRILFAAFHPVDPQVVSVVARNLMTDGHQVLFAVVEKEGIICDIVNSYGFRIKKVGRNRKSIFGKVLNVLLIDARLLITCMGFKPDIIFSPSSPYTGHISCLLGIKHICWGDTETATVNLKASLPFIDSLLLPNCFFKEVDSKKIIYFNSYKEIAYLHPNYFIPDSTILQKLGIGQSEKIILMRFSALHATHDIGLKSKADDNSQLILSYIKELAKHARVFISCTEKELGAEFDEYKLNIHPSQYIHLLSFCSLYIGEGTTTASEAGVLGVPWINIQKTERGYLIDQERNFGLGFRTDNISLAFETALKWIQQENIGKEWLIKRNKLLEEKIDFTAFLVWFIENYPESHAIMKKDPDYQNRFR